MGENCSNFSIDHIDHRWTSEKLMTSIALGAINLVVLIGNSLVIIAVLKYRKLRTATNVYIVSLACADMLLALLVLPFSAALEVLDYWPFGKHFCSVWLAVDVLLCTASILNLCAISMDRYLAVSRPIRYPRLMSRRRGKVIVCFVWVLSLVISLPPLIGWNDEKNGIDNKYETIVLTQEEIVNTESNILENTTFLFEYITISKNSTECIKMYPKCELTPTRGYRIYAALGSFYIPMIVMVFFYFKIYRAAIKTAISLRTGVLVSKHSSDTYKCQNLDSVRLRVHRGGKFQTKHSSIPSLGMRNTSYPILKINEDNASKHFCEIELITPRCNRHVVAFHNNIKKTLKSAASDTNLKSNGHACRNECISDDIVENVTFYFGTEMGLSRQSRPTSSYQTRHYSNSDTTPTGRNGRQRALLFVNKGLSGQKFAVRKFVKETKAAKTVAIIVGAFIICWMPFFTIYLIGAFCRDCVPQLAFSIIFWLGYCNSMINPIIYAMFSRDFRGAFQNLLSCRGISRPRFLERAFRLGNFRKQFVMATMESESLSDY